MSKSSPWVRKGIIKDTMEDKVLSAKKKLLAIFYFTLVAGIAITTYSLFQNTMDNEIVLSEDGEPITPDAPIDETINNENYGGYGITLTLLSIVLIAVIKWN